MYCGTTTTITILPSAMLSLLLLLSAPFELRNLIFRLPHKFSLYAPIILLPGIWHRFKTNHQYCACACWLQNRGGYKGAPIIHLASGIDSKPISSITTAHAGSRTAVVMNGPSQFTCRRVLIVRVCFGVGPRARNCHAGSAS